MSGTIPSPDLPQQRPLLSPNLPPMELNGVHQPLNGFESPSQPLQPQQQLASFDFSTQQFVNLSNPIWPYLNPAQQAPLQRSGRRSGGQASTVRLYKMNRSLFTVKSVWEEWKVGIYGNPSIESLVQLHKLKWRKWPSLIERNTEGKFFLRRRALIEAIDARIIEKGISEIEAIAYFEEKRIARSLDYIQKKLLAGGSL